MGKSPGTLMMVCLNSKLVGEVTIQDRKVELATTNHKQFRHLQKNEDLDG